MIAFWAVAGIIIGIVAAQSRGFNVAGGAVAGLFLGPLAVLMFFVDGLLSVSERRVRCPHCQEWTRPNATICPHCQRRKPAEPPRPSRRIIGRGLTLVKLLGLLVLGGLVVFVGGGLLVQAILAVVHGAVAVL